MSNSFSGRVNQDQLEKVLVGIVLGSVLVLQLLFKGETSYVNYLMGAHALAFLGLIFLYVKTGARDYWQGLILGLLVYPLIALPFTNDYQHILNWIQIAIFAVAGALFLYQSVKKSIEYKAFESLGFLLGVFLLFLPILSVLIGKVVEVFPLLFNFGIAFIIGTLMYNENLWDQYQKNQQKFIFLTLLICLTKIIFIVSKQF